MERDPLPHRDAPTLEESAEDLYEHAPCGYLSTLADGTIARLNQTLLDWIGGERHALLNGVRFSTLLTIGSRLYFETHCLPLLRMQGSINEIALELITPEGHARPVIVNAVLTRHADGTVAFLRITLFDSTDRRRYERELLLARRRAEQIAIDKTELLSMLSHDIRNPLNAFLFVIPMLEHDGLTPGQQRLIERLKSSSGHMLSLLDRVLQLGKAESGAYSLRSTTFAIRPLLDDIVSTYRASAEGQSLSLVASVDEAVPSIVVGDAIVLRQILSNLIGNAIKFTKVGGVVVNVRVKAATETTVTLAFEVVDTGIGIATDRLDRILEDYTQATDETAEQFGGTGLGLAIVRKMLSLYGSTVTVDSTLGKGSTFSFSLSLPTVREDEAPDLGSANEA